MRARRQHRGAQHRSRRAGSRRRDHVRRLAPLLAHAFPGPAERTKALAAYGATIGASFAVGPLVGGALTSGLDWEWIFLNIPLGVACLAITMTRVLESRDPRPRRIDWAGQLTLGGGLFLLITLYLQQVLGLTAIEAVLVYVPGTIIMFLVSGATATAGARVHPGTLISAGLVLVAAGMGLMCSRASTRLPGPPSCRA
ncbi:MAG: MFS transporter [Solirubrobacteraceae bacterium]